MNPIRFRSLPFLCGLVLAPPAGADSTWCVNNATSFQQALNSAREDDTTIKLVRGDYPTLDIQGGTYDDAIDHDLTILGGYADGACSEDGRSLDPALTVFRPLSAATPRRFAFVIDGDFLLKSVTLRGYARGVDVSSSNPLLGADDQWALDRVRVEGSGGAPFVAGGFATAALEVFSSGDADVTLRQVVVADNGKASDDCSARLYTADSAFVIQQSTFAHNAGTGLCVYTTEGAHLDVDNNVFWGNPTGLRVEGSIASTNFGLRHNTVTGGGAAPSVNVGNDSLDPQFVDAAAHDYRLLTTSPAVDAGINPPSGGTPGSDILGGPRVIGSGIDRGPWETGFDDASVLRVTTTAGAGPGSLAAAIAQSNALPGPQVIRFDIPGPCPQVIFQSQNQQLQAISDSVRIEGYSQPGSVRGAPDARTICVGLSGGQQVSTLLTIDPNASASLDVSGLGLGGTALQSGAAAIRLLAGSGHQVSGNQFGGSIGPDGNAVALGSLQSGIVAGLNASASLIGGFDPEQGNVFNGARASAIELGTTTAEPALFRVVNNFVGLRPNGSTVDANGSGITLGNSGGNYLLYNWISGNTNDGVVLKGERSDGNYVIANQIGRCPSILCLLGGNETLRGNGLHGVLVQAGADRNILNGNRIAGNGFGYAEEHGANGNALVQNLVYGNAGLGVDIGRDGVSPNDNGGLGPDGVPNFPVLAAAGGGFYSGSAAGSLTASGGRDYVIELYASDQCDASGYGEGQRFVGRTQVTTPPADPQFPTLYTTASFELPIRSTGLAGKVVTAIARDGSGATSEFSPCRDYLYSDVIFRDGFDELP